MARRRHGCRTAVAVPLAGLLVLAGGPALAQSGVEIELGGSYHYAWVGGDWFTFPSTGAAEFRYTRWGSGRWGVMGRAMVGIGGALLPRYAPAPGFGDGIRSWPSYFQILARWRADDGVHWGIGGGLTTWVEDGRVRFGAHTVAGEALVSRRLNERFTLRFGASTVVPVSVNPVVVLAWDR